MSNSLVQPLLALMLLTLLVWLVMYVRRIGYMRANRISAQQLSTPDKRSLLSEPVNRPSNNLINLFEMPVLFYALCLLLMASNQVDALYVQLAWAFVGLRALHSLIQCTVNIVIWRFVAYLLSSLVLAAMIIRCAMHNF
ncbi:MAG: hypothetical protein E6Q43_01200 [Dokdonella sp.]|nr:MAG: hypothetical protein EYC71_07015 [Gammaproteobacteria bacterium]TXI77379.1 MAG: hypothetical protein E6Q43_01200 [Dokdonella sp.]